MPAAGTLCADLTLTEGVRRPPSDAVVRRHLQSLVRLVEGSAPGVETTRRRSQGGAQAAIGITFRGSTASLARAQTCLRNALRELPYTLAESASGRRTAKTSKDKTSDTVIVEDISPEEVLRPGDISIPAGLLLPRNAAIGEHRAFRGIYGRDPHIRRALLAIDAFRRSAEFAGGSEEVDFTRNHVLYWGPPECGKSRILRGIRRLLPKGAYFSIDAPSCTRAGLVKIFRDTYRNRTPPVIFLEEPEKVPVDILVKLLTLLDERAELSKFTHHVQDKIRVNAIWVAACNDKPYLDRILKGALGSRFSHQIYVPRPNAEEMRLILTDRVQEMGGNLAWVDACLSLMERFGTDRPRMVKGWLDYGAGLLDGSAEVDLVEMYELEQGAAEDRSYQSDQEFDVAADTAATSLYPDAEIRRRRSLVGMMP